MDMLRELPMQGLKGYLTMELPIDEDVMAAGLGGDDKSTTRSEGEEKRAVM